MTTLEEQRVQTLDAAQAILSRAMSAGRALTPSERAECEAKIKSAEDLLVQIKTIEDDKSLRAKLASALGGFEQPNAGQFGRWSAKSATAHIVEQMLPVNSKSIAPSGSVTAPAGLTLPAPIPLDRPATSLLAVLDAIGVTAPPSVSYIVQNARDNNASVVAEGAEKPVSTMGLTRVNDVLKVVATLSENIDRFILIDNPSVLTWVQTELVGNVDVATEQLIFTTLAATIGVQAQPFDTDIATTLRKGLTRLQNVGADNPIAVLSPTDYEALSLMRSTIDTFVATDAVVQSVPGGSVSPPFGAAALMSWGVPTVISVAATPGTAWLVSRDALRIFTAGTVQIDWSDSQGFTTNELTGRAEVRVLPAVLQPIGVVKTTVAGS